MKRTLFVILFVAILLTGLATTAYAGGSQYVPVDGRQYKLVKIAQMYPWADESYLDTYGNCYGTEYTWTDGEGTEHTSYTFGYRDPRYKGISFMTVEVMEARLSRRAKQPKVAFYSDGSSFPVRAVVTSAVKVALAPVP